MGQKKVLKLWQMIILVVLLVCMLITMFLPAFQYNGKTVGKMYSYVVKILKEKTEDSIFSGLIDSAIADEMEQEDIDEIDDDVKETEEKYDIKISGISPARIMSRNMIKMLRGNQYTKDDLNDLKDDLGKKTYKKLTGGYNKVRGALISVYAIGLLLMILVIVSFACKLDKKLPAITSLVYGVLAMGIFGYLRFGLMRSFVSKNMDNLEDMVGDWVDISKVTGSTAAFSKLMSYCYSIAFLAAFIVAVLLVIMGIVSLVVGEEELLIRQDGQDAFPTYGLGNMDNFGDNPFGNPDYGYGLNDNPFGGYGSNGNQQEPEVIPVTEAAASVVQQPVGVLPQPEIDMVLPMGKVRCTKGVAMGQGFQLPEDRKVIVGKNPQKANLVINDPSVSGVHCSIRYQAANNTYSIIDHSTNGTYVNGVRLQKDVPMQYPAGTVLTLANENNEITLG